MHCLSQFNTIKTFLFISGFVLIFSAPLSCKDEEDTNSVDTDSNTTSDTDTDTDGDLSGVCISAITGRFLYDNGDPITDTNNQICNPNCSKLTPDANGVFTILTPGPNSDCRYYDFTELTKYIHIILRSSDGNHARYSVSYEPTTDELSDDGVFDIGDLFLYELPSESVEYSASSGASVSLSDVSFELSSNSLLTKSFVAETSEVETIPVEQVTIKVFKAVPFDDWNVPFNYLDLDALYFIGPYWAQLKDGGIVIEIEPPSGWAEGDTGTLYMLGEYDNGIEEIFSDFIYQSTDNGNPVCVNDKESNEKLDVGHLGECGIATVTNGKVITTPIPRFGWIGIKK